MASLLRTRMHEADKRLAWIWPSKALGGPRLDLTQDRLRRFVLHQLCIVLVGRVEWRGGDPGSRTRGRSRRPREVRCVACGSRCPLATRRRRPAPACAARSAAAARAVPVCGERGRPVFRGDTCKDSIMSIHSTSVVYTDVRCRRDTTHHSFTGWISRHCTHTDLSSLISVEIFIIVYRRH